VFARRGALVVLAGFALAVPASAGAQGEAPDAPNPAFADSPADSLPPGSGASRWGEIPPPAEENTARARSYQRRTWENVLHYPYQIIGVPLWLVGQGLGEAVAWGTESPTANRILHVATLSFLPFESSLGVTAGGDDGLGVSFTGDAKAFRNPSDRLRVALRYTTKDNSKATLGVIFNADGARSTSFGIGYRLKPDTRYYGIGPQTTADQLSYHTTETAWGGGGFRSDFGKGVFAEILGMYTAVATRGPRAGEDPPLEERFPEREDQPAGYGERSEGLALTLALGRDGTSVRGRPQHGNLARAFASWFTATDGTGVEHWSYRLEVQQFLPLWHTRRGFAMRGYFTRILNLGTDAVPFQRLLANDEPDIFRGYKDFRFRGSGMLGLSLEYRFPVWNYSSLDDLGVDAYIFADWGQVFGRTDEVALDNLARSLGVGWRVITTERFMLRLEIGFSEEGTIFRLASEQIFQFQKGGVIHGRSPVPVR
jgi:outer membrane protein assembly factor BamA